jgi:hypothetical protein
MALKYYTPGHSHTSGHSHATQVGQTVLQAMLLTDSHCVVALRQVVPRQVVPQKQGAPSSPEGQDDAEPAPAVVISGVFEEMSIGRCNNRHSRADSGSPVTRELSSDEFCVQVETPEN